MNARIHLSNVLAPVTHHVKVGLRMQIAQFAEPIALKVGHTAQQTVSDRISEEVPGLHHHKNVSHTMELAIVKNVHIPGTRSVEMGLLRLGQTVVFVLQSVLSILQTMA